MNLWSNRKIERRKKSTNSQLLRTKSASRRQHLLATAISIVFVFMILTQIIQAADPGHDAASIGAGTFEAGNFLFQNNITVATDVLFVDGTQGRVGIGTSSPSYKLEIADDVEDALNVSGVLYVNGSSGRVGFGTASPQQELDIRDDSSPQIVLVDNTNNAGVYISAVDTRGLIGTNSNHNLRIMTNGGWVLEIGTDKSIIHNGGTTLMNADGFIPAASLDTDYEEDSSLDCGTSNALIKRSGSDTYGCSNIIDGGSSTALTIDSNNNVGIGTTGPSKLLDVNGTSGSITFDPDASTPTINTTGPSNLTIASSGGDVIIVIG